MICSVKHLLTWSDQGGQTQTIVLKMPTKQPGRIQFSMLSLSKRSRLFQASSGVRSLIHKFKLCSPSEDLFQVYWLTLVWACQGGSQGGQECCFREAAALHRSTCKCEATPDTCVLECFSRHFEKMKCSVYSHCKDTERKFHQYCKTFNKYCKNIP